jgi:spermidine/putrescine-binding protein
MTEAAHAAASSNTLHYASPNKAALPLINEELLLDRTVYPSDETQARCTQCPVWSMEQERKMNQEWRLIQEAAKANKKEAEAQAQAESTQPPNPAAAPDRKQTLTEQPQPGAAPSHSP